MGILLPSIMAFRTALLVASVLLLREGQALDEDNQIMALLDDDVGSRDAAFDSDSVAMHQEAAFHEFISTHRKEYSEQEYSKRFEIYKDNLEFVRKFNSEGHGFKVAINEMADLSDTEFAASYLNSELEENYLTSSTYLSTSRSTRDGSRRLLEEDESEGGKYGVRWHKNSGSQPESTDWSHKGALSAIDNQAKCFACYAFSAAGATEAAVHITGGKLVKLSAQQIVDCSDEYRNHRCKGGTMVKSYKYIADNGLMKEHDYKYNTILNSSPQCKQTYSKCKYDKSQEQQAVEGYVNIVQGSAKDIKNAVATRPVTAAIDAHHRPFKLYSSGVFSLAACTTHLTHGLLIVGYGSQDGKPYWKVKNSWGTSWGEGGFGKVARGENMCSIEDWVNYPMIDAADASRVSAVRTLAELGDAYEAQADDSDADDQSYAADPDTYNVNGGYETPWGTSALEESQDATSKSKAKPNSDK